jgi:zinc transport system substrate-binding protein
MRQMSLLVVGFLLTAGCSGGDGGRRTIVASIYPLAYAAERIAGPGWEVTDLTPPGVEAHDLELSIEDRSSIQEADVVVFVGDIGFQPQVEDSVAEASGTVVSVTDGVELVEGGEEEGLTFDPHFWLDPVKFGEVFSLIDDALGDVDPDGSSDYIGRSEDMARKIDELDQRYEEGLHDCETRKMIVSHEAFGYLADRYGLTQIGLAGLEPEGEPTAAAVQAAVDLLRAGDAKAVFYEASAEAKRIAESVASDAGVKALPLGTLESEPTGGDYLTVMEDNLRSLQEGLQCQ